MSFSSSDSCLCYISEFDSSFQQIGNLAIPGSLFGNASFGKLGSSFCQPGFLGWSKVDKSGFSFPVLSQDSLAFWRVQLKLMDD
jgi:hypothetical protein